MITIHSYCLRRTDLWKICILNNDYQYVSQLYTHYLIKTEKERNKQIKQVKTQAFGREYCQIKAIWEYQRKPESKQITHEISSFQHHISTTWKWSKTDHNYLNITIVNMKQNQANWSTTESFSKHQ